MMSQPIDSLDRQGAMRLESEIGGKAGPRRPICAMERPVPPCSGAVRRARGAPGAANGQVEPRWKIHSAHRRFI